MRVALVGSDCEENLGLSMVAAALVQARHQVDVIAFNEARELNLVAERIVRLRPKLVGLGIQFQHRACDFLMLAKELRTRGYRGHITCGGQYPTMAWSEVLEHDPAIDSIVLHEAEGSIVELCEALSSRQNLATIPGLALRNADQGSARTAPRALCADLDQLPMAYRYRAPARHLGLAFRPIWGSRGCWGSCAFCAITTYYRDAHKYGGGRKVRLRSTESIAAEMAALWHMEGGTTLFCFHDDTILLPRPTDSIARLTDLRNKLDELGVGRAGIIGKCRPDCVTPELAREFRRLGVIRMFVGVENGSQQGLDHLGRRMTLEEVEQALSAFESAGIFVCYNLLLFEPDALLADVRQNIDFIRKHAHIPVNFCRAEPYHGTPLYQRVKERGTLLGSYLGWDYRIHDNRTELAFRIAAAVFRERNYDADGVANRNMGLGYTAQLLRSFYNVKNARGQRLLDRVAEITKDICRDTADLLERAVDIAEAADLGNHDRITRETAMLGLRALAHNRASHAALDDLIADICSFVAEQPRTAQTTTVPERARAVLERMTLAGCMVAGLQACSGEVDNNGSGSTGGVAGATAGGGTGNTGGGAVYDMVPPSGGRNATGGTMSIGGMYADPIPPTGGRYGTGGGAVYDMVPPSGGRSGTGGTANTGGKSASMGGVYGDGGAPPTGGTTSRIGTGVGGFYADPLPPTGGRFNTGGGAVYDMVPPSGGRNATGGQSATGGHFVVSDVAPPTGGVQGNGGSNKGGQSTSTGGMGTGGGFIVDCVVRAGGVGADPSNSFAMCTAENAIDGTGVRSTVDPAPPNVSSVSMGLDNVVVENWRDTSPRHLVRSNDLALFDPPNIVFESKVIGDTVRVVLNGDDPSLSLRWECEGTIEGDGREVTWKPASIDDALCVAARGSGGITVASLRARDLDSELALALGKG
jgi:radical SAM superfamily enzyme YgiQ (UPF0313 family)